MIRKGRHGPGHLYRLHRRAFVLFQPGRLAGQPLVDRRVRACRHLLVGSSPDGARWPPSPRSAPSTERASKTVSDRRAGRSSAHRDRRFPRRAVGGMRSRSCSLGAPAWPRKRNRASSSNAIDPRRRMLDVDPGDRRMSHGPQEHIEPRNRGPRPQGAYKEELIDELLQVAARSGKISDIGRRAQSRARARAAHEHRHETWDRDTPRQDRCGQGSRRLHRGVGHARWISTRSTASPAASSS